MTAVRIVTVTMISKKKVLVIEDERPIAEPLADALRREGFDVQLAGSAAEGLDAFSGYAPDVVGDRGVLDAELQFLPKPFTRLGLLTRVRELLHLE